MRSAMPMSGKRGRVAPGPRGLPLTGNLWWVRRDVLGFLERLRRDHGGVVRARMGHLVFHLGSDPTAIEQVLGRGAARSPPSPRANRRLPDIPGSSLLTTGGPGWRARRKLIAPAFAPERIAASAELIHGVVERVLDD